MRVYEINEDRMITNVIDEKEVPKEEEIKSKYKGEAGFYGEEALNLLLWDCDSSEKIMKLNLTTGKLERKLDSTKTDLDITRNRLHESKNHGEKLEGDLTECRTTLTEAVKDHNSLVSQVSKIAEDVMMSGRG